MKKAIKYIIVGIVCAGLSACLTNLYRDLELFFFADGDEKDILQKKIAMVDTILEEGYIYDIDEKAMADYAVKGYVAGLDEPYTSYFTEEEFKNYTDSLEDSYVGIGVVISPTEDNFIEVVSAVEGSTAYQAGIKPGDIIYKVDGEEYFGDTMDNAITKIKGGKEGEKVTLTLVRDGKEIEMEIERRVVVMNSVSSKMIDDQIGYLKISSFNVEGDESDTSTYTEFCEHIENLKKSNVKKLIIDLRDNPGGALEVVVDVADELLPEGLVTYIEYKDGTKEEHKSDKECMDIPIVVLVNENSASASEVLTGALKDHKKATVVGNTTYGKGVVQTVFPFSDGSGMSVTIAKYYTPSGVCIHGTGIEPDIKVELDEKYKNYYASELTFEEDIQLQKAIEILK